jgi:glutamyl-tRNA reductase
LRLLELDRARRLLANGEPPEKVIEQLSQALTAKFLHDPLSALRETGDNAEHDRLRSLLARFYSIREN